MNAFINSLAFSYIQKNVDSINDCIKSYIEDGDPLYCENPAIEAWVDEHGPELFKQVKCPEKKCPKQVKSSKKEQEEIERLKKEKEETEKEKKRRKEFIVDFEEIKSGEPHAFGKEVSDSMMNNIAGMENSDCKFYSDSIGYTWGGNSNDGNVYGCFLRKDAKTAFYNEKEDTVTNCDGVAGSTCVQRDNQHVDKKDCAFYAGNIGYRWGGNSNDGNVKGCFVQHGAKTVYFNEKNTDTKCEDVDGSTCIQKKKPEQEDQKYHAAEKQKRFSFQMFTDIPKKRNERVYVILFLLFVFLYFLLKK